MLLLSDCPPLSRQIASGIFEERWMFLRANLLAYELQL